MKIFIVFAVFLMMTISCGDKKTEAKSSSASTTTLNGSWELMQSSYPDGSVETSQPGETLMVISLNNNQTGTIREISMIENTDETFELQVNPSYSRISINKNGEILDGSYQISGQTLMLAFETDEGRIVAVYNLKN